MAGRYLITGVQIGMLLAIRDDEDRKELLDRIQKEQFIRNSKQSIKDDVKDLQQNW